MRLTPEAVRAAERGDKTEHRLLVREPREVRRPGPQTRGGKRPQRAGDSATYMQQPFRPSVGDSLVIQPEYRDEDPKKDKPEVRVQVTAVRTELLGEIKPVDAIAEGHKTLADFAHHWMSRHSSAWPPLTEALCKNCDGHATYVNHDGEHVPCGECEIGVVDVPYRPDDPVILDRFERKHAHHLVWVITFEIQHDYSRFLNRRAHLPATTSIGEALDPDAPLLGPPRPNWKENSEALRQAALRERDGARLAGLERLGAQLEAEALRLALESNTDVGSLVREVRHKVDRIKGKVTGRSDQHRRAA